MQKKYYIYIKNKVIGPYEAEELKKLPIKPKTLLWAEGSTVWKRANEYSELKEIINTKDSISADNINQTQIGNFPPYKRTIFSGKGRINRIEYLLSIIVFSIGISFTNSLRDLGSLYFSILLYFILIWFILAQGTKRCHDFGKRGWYQLIPLYPLYMLIKKGDEENNRYGPVQ